MLFSLFSFVLRPWQFSVALLLRPPPWFLTLWKVKGEGERGGPKMAKIQHGVKPDILKFAQETRSQRTGRTTGEKEHSQWQAKRACPSRGRAVPSPGKNSYLKVRDESGQNVIKDTDKTADVPTTTQHQVPTTMWFRKSRRPRRSHSVRNRGCPCTTGRGADC